MTNRHACCYFINQSQNQRKKAYVYNMRFVTYVNNADMEVKIIADDLISCVEKKKINFGETMKNDK